MKEFSRNFKWVFLLLLLPFLAKSDSFRQFGVEHGLPQSSMQCMVQDRDGNLWIGTMAGVSKYNGLSFHNYSVRDGLAEERVTTSLIDRKGFIWFGHWGGGISRFDPEKKIFEIIRPGEIALKKPIMCIYEDRKGIFWMGTEGLGLLRIDPQDFSKASIISQKEGLFSKNVYAIIEDQNEGLLLGTEIGLSRFQPERNSIEKLYNNSLPQVAIHSLLRDSKGNIWIGTGSSGLYILPSKMVSDPNPKFLSKKSTLNFPILFIQEDDEEMVWVGSDGAGVMSFNTSIQELSACLENPKVYAENSGLSNNRTLSFLQDREKNYWIGTALGLNQSMRRDISIYGRKEGLESEQVSCIVREENFILLGTGSGIWKAEFGNGLTNPVFTSILDSKTRIDALCIDRKGRIWFASNDQGIRVRESNGQVRNVPGNFNQIASIIEDHSGFIWLGTMKGGAIRIDPITFKSSVYGISDGFKSTTIQTVFCDSKGRIWFGTPGGYLTMFDGKSFKSFAEEEGVLNNFILCINEDLEGNIWCGTYDGSLYKFIETTGKFIPSSTALGETIHSIVFDDLKQIWIGTATSVKAYQLDEKGLLGAKIKGGFSGIEISSNAVVRGQFGSFWYGTLSGLVRHTPTRFLENTAEPITRISGLEIFFKDHPIEQGMILPYDQNYLSFRFEGVCLTEPFKVLYRFQLVGLDKNLSPPVAENFVSYPSLGPGSYTLKVYAANNDGVWNEQPAELTFSVASPFWKTWWFRIILLIAIAGITWSIFRLRIQQIEKREKEKTALSKKIANIELTALRSQMNPHFIFNTMNSIQHFVVSRDPDAAQKYLAKFAELIRSILNNSSLSYVPLSEELRSLSLYMELESLRFENKFEFEFIVDPVLENGTVEIPTMLIQPYIENSIVHGLMNKIGPGKITVKMDQVGNLLKCTVEDNGIGREAASKIRSTSKPKHKSLGLAITKERLEILNMESGIAENADSIVMIDLYDDAGNASGTRVELFIPLSNEED